MGKSVKIMSEVPATNLKEYKMDRSNEQLQPIDSQPPELRLQTPAQLLMPGYIPTGFEYLGPEYLNQMDSVFIQQKIELLEAFTGWETENKYKIKNSAGQTIFYAIEKSDCCNRCCLGNLREFDIRITNFSGKELIGLQRHVSGQGIFCWCCLQSINVAFPTGNAIGSVEEIWSFCNTILAVKDNSGQKIYVIKGPDACTLKFCPPTFCCNDIVFEISNATEGECVGTIIKKWSGFSREVFTDADNFQIIFPSNATVENKAILIGATFLIDFMYFEDTQGR